MAHVVSISGSVGVGKTTLATRLVPLLQGSVIIPEEVSVLHYLPRFYEDRPRFALHSRLEFLLLKARQMSNVAGLPGFAILDRSVPELITFARALLAAGEMPADDFKLYEGLYRLVASLITPVQSVIWVRADLDTMLQRIAARGRPFEANITRGYLERVEQEYERWFAALPPMSATILDTSALGTDETADLAASWLRRRAT